MNNLIQWSPIRDLERLFEDDLTFPRAYTRTPAVDLYETDNEVVAEVSIPGMDPKQVQVEIENNVLHIRSEQSEEHEDQGKGYYRKEVRRGMFARSMALPVEVDADRVSAHAENGILKVAMPKSEKAKPKKVNVEIK